MSLGFRLLIAGCGLILFVFIFALVRSGKLREELSISWFLIALALIFSSIADFVIDPLAIKLKIYYPPALIFALFLLLLVLAFLYFSVVISGLKGKVKELTQKIALMEFEIQNKKKNS